MKPLKSGAEYRNLEGAENFTELVEFYPQDEDHSDFFPEKSRVEILEFLSELVGSTREESACLGAVLLGNKGMGKSSLCHVFFNHHVEALNLNAAVFDASTLKPNLEDAESLLFSSILESLGVPNGQCNNLDDFQQSLMDFSKFSLDCGRSVIVLIDNAGHLGEQLISSLIKVSEKCLENSVPVYWVFFSEPGIEHIFDTFAEKHKNLEIDKKFPVLRLTPFHYEDMKNYLDFKWKQVAKGQGIELNSDQIHEVFKISQGNPGMVPQAVRRVLSKSGSASIIREIPRWNVWAAAGVMFAVLFLLALPPLQEIVKTEGYLSENLLPDNKVGEVNDSKEWFLDQNPESYTIQLISGSNVESIDNYMQINSYNVGGNAFHKYKFEKNDKAWYVLFCGVFDSRTEALAFSEKLPKNMQVSRPWARSFEHIQQEIHKM